MTISLLVASAVLYVLGGVLMKQSDGLRRLPQTFAFVVLFALGALLQGYAMRREPMGVAYLGVLGLEAVLAFAASVIILHEQATTAKLIAAGLILAGLLLLRR